MGCTPSLTMRFLHSGTENFPAPNEWWHTSKNIRPFPFAQAANERKNPIFPRIMFVSGVVMSHIYTHLHMIRILSYFDRVLAFQDEIYAKSI